MYPYKRPSCWYENGLSAVHVGVIILSFASHLCGGQVVLGVIPTLCEQGDNSCAPVLIEPTTVPSYVGCIKDVGKECVNGNGVRAQAPFDPSTACPTTPIYGPNGFSVDRTALEDQIGACINSVRENPDAFACEYPCNYSSWRSDVISPPRGGLATSGTQAVTQLHAAAYQHSLDMASNNFFSHTGSDGSGLEDRAANNNFYTFPLGENIAAGYVSVRATVLAWMCSSGHRTNLMGCGFDSVGTGAAFNMTSCYKDYFTQDFGCSRDDFNCQCPQVVNPATGQPVPQPLEPVCGGPPTPATAAGQALGGAKAAVPTSSAKAPAPAPPTTPSKAGTPVPAPAASKVTGAAAAKPPAVAPASAPARAPVLAPGAAPVAAKGNIPQTEVSPAQSPSSGAARSGPVIPGPAPAASATNAPTSAAAYPYASQPVIPASMPSSSAAQSAGAAVAAPPVAVLAAEVPAPAAASVTNGSSAVGTAPATSPVGGAQRPLGLYATSMELPGASGALAATNQPTAVIVASLGPFTGALSATDVSATLSTGASAAVADVQPFPDEPATYMIEVLHPAGFTGTVTVSLPAFPALQPLTYSVVSRDLVVQSLGFSICPLTFGAL